jgi:phosphohistidine phosphatase SixA
VRIFLVRHAEAAPGEPDELRPLTPEGRAAARELGERLALQRPDAVLTSPLLRARETAEPVARAAGLEPHVDERLGPGANVESLSSAVTGRGEAVVVIAHQPDCGEIVLALTGEEVRFPPGGFVELDL